MEKLLKLMDNEDKLGNTPTEFIYKNTMKQCEVINIETKKLFKKHSGFKKCIKQIQKESDLNAVTMINFMHRFNTYVCALLTEHTTLLTHNEGDFTFYYSAKDTFVPLGDTGMAIFNWIESNCEWYEIHNPSQKLAKP